MKKSLIPLFLFILFVNPVTLKASVKLDFNTVDELTYRYFLEKKWDSVILIGKQALHVEIDYYYLRVRMGLAYYEQKEYIPAATHLVKARQFDPKDPVIADYLYYAYLFTNRMEEARLLQASLPEAARNIADRKKGFMDAVTAESGYTFSSNNALKDKPSLMGTDSVYGETDVYGNYLYEHLGLKFNISNRIGINVAYSYLNFSKTKYIQYARIEDQLTSIADSSWGKYYHYAFPRVTYDTSFHYNVSQHEIHAGLSWYLNGGFRIAPAVHLIHVSYPVISASAKLVTVNDTGYFLSQTREYVTFPFDRTIYSYTSSDTSFTNYVVALTLSKDIGRFNIGLSGSWSNLNNKKQKQVGASLTWLPFGNLSLYSTTSVTGFFQSKGNRLLLSQVIGAKITSWCWAEGSFYYGDYTNANLMNGTVVYNNSDVIDYRGSANLYFLVGKHIQLSLIYQYARKESQQYYFTTDPTSNEVSSKPTVLLNPYNTHTIIGGITWKL
jgi:hypothetical protein